MAHIDSWTVLRRHVLTDTENDELFQDAMLTPEEAGHINEKLAADGSHKRWVAFAEREGDTVAA